MASSPDAASSSQTKPIELPNIEPLPPRYEPLANPRLIQVPGLDTTAPVQDQIEQIEQLITIKLQNIDANFARVQQILSTRILPAVKRYSINTQPVRDAARFWVSFFEQAAQVHIPTSDDFSSATGEYSEERQQSGSLTPQGLSVPGGSTSHASEDGDFDDPSHHDADSRHFNDHSIPDSNSSFIPITGGAGQGAVSSTPMAYSHGRSKSHSRHPSGSQAEDLTYTGKPLGWDETLSASIESPLDRLDRGLRSLRDEDDESHVQNTTSHPTKTAKGKEKNTSNPSATPGSNPSLLHNVLSKNHQSQQQGGASGSTSRTSPLKVRVKTYGTPKLKRDWDGIVDLRSPRPLTVATAQDISTWADSDEDEDGWPPGMSPPVTMDYARPTWRPAQPVKGSAHDRSAVSTSTVGGSSRTNLGQARSTAPRIAQSPAKNAAKRIGRDLVGAVGRTVGAGGGESKLPVFQPKNKFGFKPPAQVAHPAPPVLAAGYALGHGGGHNIGEDASVSSTVTAPSLTIFSKRSFAVDEDSVDPSFDLPQRGSFDRVENSAGGTDVSLSELMRQVGLPENSGSGFASGSGQLNDSFDSEDSFDVDIVSQQPAVMYAAAHSRNGSSGSSSDDSYYDGNGNPQPAFAMPNSGQALGFDDDSFALERQQGGGGSFPNIQQPAAVAFDDDSFDDSFEYNSNNNDEVIRRSAFDAVHDEDDPTVFGARAVAVRTSGGNVGAFSAPQAHATGRSHGSSVQLRLHGQSLLAGDAEGLDDTDTIGFRIGGNAPSGQHGVPETPTPWGGTGRGS